MISSRINVFPKILPILVMFDFNYSDLGTETREQPRNLRKFAGREKEGGREEGAGEEEDREFEYRTLIISGRELIRGHTVRMFRNRRKLLGDINSA